MQSEVAVQTAREPKRRQRDRQTKWKIFIKAVDLFAEQGIDAVSIRNIASAVGIQAGSIYNHYESKEQLVQEMYDFLLERQGVAYIDADEIIRLTETATADEVFALFALHFPDEYEDVMCKIIQIAMYRMRTDKAAYAVIDQIYGKRTRELMSAVLKRLMELKKIRPIDLDAYVDIYVHMSFSVSYFMYTDGQVDHNRWESMNRQFFSLLNL